jgi:3-oxoadipate enol-lactonase
VVVEVAHEVQGPLDGPPLVLSNSLGTTRELWDPQLEVLTARHRVVQYDHRGHGRSPVPPGPYSIADLGRDVLRMLDTLELPSVSFCGTSLGGMVGMWLASHASDRIESLIVLCSAAHLPPPDAWHARAALVRAEGTAAVADAVAARWFTEAFRRDHPDVVDHHVDGLRAIDAEGYAGCCEAIGDMDLRGDLGRILAPTLVIAGRDDPATTVTDASVLAERIARARLIVVDAAHLANVERADVVTDVMTQHLLMTEHSR